MAITLLVSAKAHAAGGNSATTSGIDTTGATLIEISVGAYLFGTLPPTVADNKGNTYKCLSIAKTQSAIDIQKWFLINPAVGSGHTFTVTSVSGYVAFIVTAYSGSNLVYGININNSAASGTALSTGSVTSLKSPALVTSAISVETNGAGIAATSPMTIIDSINYGAGSNYGIATSYEIQTSATARNPAWTWTNSNPSAGITTCYFESSIVKIAQVSASPGTNGGASGSIDTTGASFLVMVAGYVAAGGASVSDSKSNSWNALTIQTSAGGTAGRIWWCEPTSVGSGHTFTLTGTANNPAFIVYAFSGIDTTPFNSQAGGTTFSNAISTSFTAPSVDECLCISGLAADGISLIYNTAGFTMTSIAYSGGNNVHCSAGWWVQAAAVSTNPVYSWTTNSWCALTGAFFEPGAVVTTAEKSYAFLDGFLG